MTYAHRDDIYDADTHMMEHANWIADFADPSIRDRVVPYLDGVPVMQDYLKDAMEKFDQRRSDTAFAAKVDDNFMSMRNKGWHALGGWDRDERAHANNLLGFKGSIVFPSRAFRQVVDAKDPEVHLGSVRALNRGMAYFCEKDSRMYGTAYLPLATGPETCLQILDEIIAAGFAIVLIDTVAPEGNRSFTHPDYDLVWDKIQAEELAITLHIGVNGGYNPVPSSIYNNGRQTRMHFGDAPSEAATYMTMQYNAEIFLSTMIFDGVFERFPLLKIGVIELGAEWVVSWLKQLDQAQRIFKNLQDLSHLTMAPSDYARRHVRLTPFTGEDIGWIMSMGAEDMLMFASDYPHLEGSDDPIRRFENTMGDLSEGAKTKFYSDNFKNLLGARLRG